MSEEELLDHCIFDLHCKLVIADMKHNIRPISQSKENIAYLGEIAILIYNWNYNKEAFDKFGEE